MASGGSKSDRTISPVEEESSGSDEETEPAKSFHRRLSTNRDIKCSASLKEGYLLKQTWSFQRWRRRYFKLKGRKLYYAKDTKELTPESTLRLNMDYSNTITRFTITSPIQQEPPPDAARAMKIFEEDRTLYLQAAIVRVMKFNKELEHSVLVKEVCAESKQTLVPSMSIIKKCIEELIDKRYIRRTSSEGYSFVV